MACWNEESTTLECVWDEFCNALKRAGDNLVRPGTMLSPLDRAEGFRYLSRLLRIALEMQLESGDARFPSFMVPSHETAKIGADNPDNFYQVALIDGRWDYRVKGNRKDATNINFSTKRGGYDRDGRLTLSRMIEAKAMQFEPDGSFELILSQHPHPGNWLQLEPDAAQLLIRQFLPKRREQTRAEISIERMDADGARPEPLCVEDFTERLSKAANFVENTAKMFCDWVSGYLARPNELPPADQALCQSVGGDPNIFYYHGYWRLGNDEALVIRIPHVPPCEYWNFVVQNYWMESLDFRHFNVVVNKETAVMDADGGVTIVVAHRDPGCPNWLETAGHWHGTMCFRWVGATEHIHPNTRVVKFDMLSEGLKK